MSVREEHSEALRAEFQLCVSAIRVPQNKA